MAKQYNVNIVDRDGYEYTVTVNLDETSPLFNGDYARRAFDALHKMWELAHNGELPVANGVVTYTSEFRRLAEDAAYFLGGSGSSLA